MTRYPDHSGPSVLIGANPKGYFHLDKKELSPIYNTYERYISDQLPPHPNGLEGLMAETLKNAPNRAWGIKIDRDRIRVVTHALLFHVKTAPLLLDAYLKAYEDQDYKGLALLSLAYNFVFPRIFQWGDFTFKALTEDFDPARDYLSESQPLAGEIGSPISELFFTAPLGKIISNLEMPKLEPIQITTPTLILSGELDFSTPPQIATRNLAEPFAAVHQVIVPGLGHVDDFIAQPGPTFQLASQWMNSATLGKVAFQSPPIQLHKTIGIGEALPIGLVVVFLVFGVVVGGVWWFFRKLKGN